MYKLVIADDEPVVRQGLSAVFDWATLGIELAGQADDGDTGLELIERIKPDIVLTDIMMPAMDGNRMAKAVREQLDFLGLKLPTKQPYLVPVATIDSTEVLVGRTERPAAAVVSRAERHAGVNRQAGARLRLREPDRGIRRDHPARRARGNARNKIVCACRVDPGQSAAVG